MSSFGFVVVFVNAISLFVGYGIYRKILGKPNDKKEAGAIEKVCVFLFICLLMVCINTMTFVAAYVFVWEKTYRAYAEVAYEATVVGYKKEIVKAQNFGGSSRTDTAVFFPEVRYVSRDGQEVTKTLDLTSNEPLALGEKIKITDSDSQASANALDVNWIMLLAASVFTGVAGFFASLLTLYISNYDLKKKVRLSRRFAVGLLVLNSAGVLLLHLKTIN